MNIEILPAKHWDCIDLAPRLREADKHEVWAASGHFPGEALTGSLACSDPDMVWTAFIDGQPEVMWGVAPLYPNVGTVWLLASDRLAEIKGRFFMENVKYIKLMHERYLLLTNFIHHANLKSLRWLDALGFYECETHENFGFGKEKFIRYESSCASPQL